MSVNLQKGQRVDLTKGNTSLKRIMVGLGWDEANNRGGGKRGLFGALLGNKSSQAIDCDASVFLLDENNKLRSKSDIVYFGNLTHSSGAVKHMGDNLTGEGEGDDEQILITLADVPSSYNKLLFVVNIYQAKQRNQHFGMIENAFIRIFDVDTNKELCKFNLSEDYSNMTAVISGEVYRQENDWKFSAIGQANTDEGLQKLSNRYI